MRKFLLGFVLGVAFLPIASVAAERLGLLTVRADHEPPAWERRLARSALRASLAKSAVGVASPLSGDEESLMAGMKIYRNNCAGCHGELGQPSLSGTSGFYSRVPQLADHPALLTAPEMYLVVKHGIRYTGMGAWNTLLPDQDIWRVALFLSRVRDLPPAVDAAWRQRVRAGGA